MLHNWGTTTYGSAVRLRGLFIFISFLTFLAIPKTSFAADCSGVTAWSAGCIGAGPGTQRTHGGKLWEVNNWWECNEPGTGGSWIDRGSCSNGPGLTTDAATSITATTATLNGNVTSDNGYSITERGFIYYTTEANVDAATVTTPGSTTVTTHGTSSTGTYDITVTSLTRNVTYYFKAYAINSEDTTYGSTLSFTTTNTGIKFTSNADGAWTTSTIWMPNGTPNLDGAAPLDTVVIGHAVTYTGDLLLEDGNMLETTAAGSFTLTGDIEQGTSGVIGTLLNAGTMTISGAYTAASTGGVFTNSGTFTAGSFDSGTSSFDYNNTGDIVTTGDFTHSGAGSFTSTAGTITVGGDMNAGPDAADISLSSTTSIDVTGDLNIVGSGSITTDSDSPISIGGNFSNTGTVSSVFNGAFTITGNLNNTGSSNITFGGVSSVGGAATGSGATKIIVNGELDITGLLTLGTGADLQGTGTAGWGSYDVDGIGTSFIICVDASQYDSKTGNDPVIPVPPANPLNLTTCGVGVLPVELISFTAFNNNGNGDLSWATGSEINNDYFEVQKSANGEEWSTIGTVQGAGTTSDIQEYSFVDYDFADKTSYYRLKQVDFNGDTQTSLIRFIQGGNGIAIYPNPVNNSESITLQSKEEVLVKIYDNIGQLVTVLEFKGSKTIPFDYSSGVYFFQINSGSETVSQRLIVK